MKKILTILLSCLLFLSFLPVCFAAETTYYIDAENGSDDADGTSPETAWRTLSGASSMTFSEGDRLLLRRGQVFSPTFFAHGNGSAEAPVTVSAYGEGALPLIDNDTDFAAFFLLNVQNWVVENLEFTAPHGAGLSIYALGDENTENITLRDCVFRDISPDRRDTGAAAVIVDTDNSNSRVRHLHFDRLTIRNAAWGIHMKGLNAESSHGNYQNPDESYNSDFLLEHIDIDRAACGGIVIASVQDCTVRNCRVLNSATVQGEPYAPLWMRHTNRTTVEYCEIAGSTNTWDGMALDFDGWTTNSTYRYIYSHDNNRFMRNCVYDLKTGNAGNSIHHCVSVNDGMALNHSAFMLFSTSRPSLSLMRDFSFHDTVILGSKPILWACTPFAEVSGITFCSTPIYNFLQRILNAFSLIRGFRYEPVDEDALSGLISEITAELPGQ